ncbi:MAG: DoxX family protein [Pseudolysinimonas sp.]
MTITVWIVTALLALANLLSGGMKVFAPMAQLQPRMPWVTSVGTVQTRLIGLAEVLGAVGIVLPVLLGIAPILTPIAAVGLALIQAIAIVFHLRRGEGKQVPMNVVLLLLALFVAVTRFAGF